MATVQELIQGSPADDQRVLSKFPMNTGSSQGLTKWLQSLPLKSEAHTQIQEAFKQVNNMPKAMSKDEISASPNAVAKYGCSVRLAGQMTDPVLMKVLLVCIKLLE